ncbi:hypothetical protein DQ384_36395 [Sphaerisporangium album]|uniref:Uncharacterized protein n=1 Tax=Sphaerisporangium album TaxID=509200 RepID=A0A367EWC8_9ACTN|nr:hypothetical protein [Sphaerisporangium album]RCG21942.1 hypothetical protein DQ384_36395 [Sphaerisporangium album]
MRPQDQHVPPLHDPHLRAITRAIKTSDGGLSPEDLALNVYTALYGRTGQQVEISPVVAAHVLWHLHARGGQPASAFRTTLILAISMAEAEHRVRLARAYPDYVAALTMGQAGGHGIAELQAIAARDGDL